MWCHAMQVKDKSQLEYQAGQEAEEPASEPGNKQQAQEASQQEQPQQQQPEADEAEAQGQKGPDQQHVQPEVCVC